MITGTIFVSSVQAELAPERLEIYDFIQGETLLRRFFDAFLFEKLPAIDQRPDEAYLDRVELSEIYLGVFGNEYGRETEGGLSSTEREFNRATESGKYRIILVKGHDDTLRHPKMRALIQNAEGQLVRRRFTDITDLNSKLYDALIEYLINTGKIRMKPLDASACQDAKIDDISPDRISWFLQKARDERDYRLPITTPISDTLTHLNLEDKGQPACGAVLLFGKNPQHFFPVATVKCLFFYGTTVEKPIPSYQIYEGPLFKQVDQAVDFVMSKINRTVTPSNDKPASDVSYEIPYKVIREAIVNAVAHRDYSSNASVQVSVFSDRVEVRNPGALPAGWTLDRLRNPHTSVPRYPLIIKPLFLTHYAEQAGTGTLDMITLSRKAGIPEPDFEQQGDEFVVTIWRNWLSKKYLDSLDLNERQLKVIDYLKTKQQITNLEYRDMTAATPKTAGRDLDDLVKKKILELKGKGRGAHYVIVKKGKPGKPAPSREPDENQDK
jgi:predicted HTH transcriptional regulator